MGLQLPGHRFFVAARLMLEQAMTHEMGGQGRKLAVVGEEAHQAVGHVDRPAVVEGIDLVTARHDQVDVALGPRHDREGMARLTAAHANGLGDTNHGLPLQHKLQGGACRLAGRHAVMADRFDLVAGQQAGGRGGRAGQDVDHAQAVVQSENAHGRDTVVRVDIPPRPGHETQVGPGPAPADLDTLGQHRVADVPQARLFPQLLSQHDGARLTRASGLVNGRPGHWAGARSLR